MLAPVAAVALLFFLALPGVGAFLARARWRGFRRSLLAVSRWPSADAPPAAAAGAGPDGFVGYRRCFGSLEALQGDDRIWLAGEAGSVAVDLRGVEVHLLPGASGFGGPDVEDEIPSVSGSRIFALSEGTTFLVGGALYREEGRSVFRARDGKPPFALIYDCPRAEIVRRAIRGGRHRNEYWNPFTVPSLVTGSFLLAVLAWVLLGQPGTRRVAAAALAAAIGPLAPFLPPAFPLYFLYRRCWRRGRQLRAERDLASLPLRWFPARTGGPDRFVTILPDHEPYAMLHGTLADAGTLDAHGLRVRLPPGAILDVEGEVWAFGALREQDGELALAEPEDPLAELVVVVGDPRARAARCSSGARRQEVLSGALIALAVAVNLFLALYLVVRLVG
jgi:hypothetical protein